MSKPLNIHELNIYGMFSMCLHDNFCLQKFHVTHVHQKMFWFKCFIFSSFLKFFIVERNLNVCCVAIEILSTKAYIMDVGKIG
jgi:hypothetical protein